MWRVKLVSTIAVASSDDKNRHWRFRKQASCSKSTGVGERSCISDGCDRGKIGRVRKRRKEAVRNSDTKRALEGTPAQDQAAHSPHCG